MRSRIYVAGPYSSDPEGNTYMALVEGQRLLERGYAPMVPHLSHFWNEVIENPYSDWLDLDLAWVAVADAVYRIPGDSPGADREVELADKLGIPVYETLADLLLDVPAERTESTTSVPQAVDRALSVMRRIFEKKNADYASDIDWKSNFADVAAQMSWGSPVEAADALVAVKQARLKSLRGNGRAPVNEALIDTYLDRAVYSLIALAMLIEQGADV